MYYIELLRTKRVMLRYLIIAGGLYLIAAFLTALYPHVGTAGGGTLYSAGGHAAAVAFICLLFASVSGSSLSRHLDHLDFALTKPRARNAFFATVLGVDVLGLTAFFLITSLVVLAFHVGLGETHQLAFDASSWFGIALAFGSVLAWYALIQAVSCDRDSARWAVGAVWVTAIGLNILSAVPLGPGLHALIVALDVINPITYLSTVPFEATAGVSPSLAAHAVAIYVVAIAAAFVALIRWQRVEI
jgi:hypothetical protein